MEIRDIKVIDTYGCGENIKETSSNMLTDPMAMQDIEEWEDYLQKRGTSYKLIQGEISMTEPKRYSKGYILLTKRGQP